MIEPDPDSTDAMPEIEFPDIIDSIKYLETQSQA